MGRRVVRRNLRRLISCFPVILILFCNQWEFFSVYLFTLSLKNWIRSKTRETNRKKNTILLFGLKSPPSRSCFDIQFSLPYLTAWIIPFFFYSTFPVVKFPIRKSILADVQTSWASNVFHPKRISRKPGLVSTSGRNLSGETRTLIDDVEVISFVSLLDDGLPWKEIDWKHGVENVWAFVLVQVREQDVLRYGFGQGRHCLVVLRHDLKRTEKGIMFPMTWHGIRQLPLRLIPR